MRNQITDVGETVRLSKGNGGKETMEEVLWVTIRVRARWIMAGSAMLPVLGYGMG